MYILLNYYTNNLFFKSIDRKTDVETRKSVAADVLSGNVNEFYTGGEKRGGNNVEMRNLIAEQFLNRNAMGGNAMGGNAMGGNAMGGYNKNMQMMPYAMTAQHNNNLYGDFNDCAKPAKKKKRRKKRYYCYQGFFTLFLGVFYTPKLHIIR